MHITFVLLMFPKNHVLVNLTELYFAVGIISDDHSDLDDLTELLGPETPLYDTHHTPKHGYSALEINFCRVCYKKLLHQRCALKSLIACYERL